MKKLVCVTLILCLGLSDFAMAAGGGGGAAGGGGGAVGGGGGVGGAGGVSGGGWYGGYAGDTGGRRRAYRAYYPYAYRTYYPYYSYRAYYPYPYQHHARQLTHDNHGRSASFKKKPVAYAMVSQEKADFRHALRTEEIAPQHHNRVSAETATKQIPRDKHTLSPGTPLLGLDARSPSTWALYSEMLPFIFSEAPAPASDRISARRRREGENGM
jgi:hypothetical protein